MALDTASYLSVDSLENFEEGQTLSAGMSYLNGGVPYRDFSVFHGLYDEPLRTAIAFKLFGPSIGAMRTFHSINKLSPLAFWHGSSSDSSSGILHSFSSYLLCSIVWNRGADTKP